MSLTNQQDQEEVFDLPYLLLTNPTIQVVGEREFLHFVQGKLNLPPKTEEIMAISLPLVLKLMEVRLRERRTEEPKVE